MYNIKVKNVKQTLTKKGQFSVKEIKYYKIFN